MRLHFNILWIDDQHWNLKGYVEGLERRLKEIGFILNVIEITSIEETEDYLRDHVHEDGVDLVLVDFNLGATSPGGDVALPILRRHFRYKDVIFYSSENPDTLRRLAFEAKVDGVYFVARDLLVNDTFEIINNILRRVLDIDHMRGIVMSATSDIDTIIKNTLQNSVTSMDPEQQNDFIQRIFLNLEKKLTRYTKELEKIKKIGTIDAIIDEHHLFTATDRLKFLLKQLEVANSSEEQLECLSLGKEYQEKIPQIRNQLAHVILTINAGVEALDSGDRTFSVEDMTDLRKELLTHRNNFQKAAELLGVTLPNNVEGVGLPS